MNKQTKLDTLARAFPFWDSLDDGARESLAGSATATSYKKDETLHDGASCTGVFIVRSGRLRVYILSDEGKEITLYRLSPGDMCMLSASCVLEAITFDVLVDAEEESECLLIPGSVFASVTERFPAAKIHALELAVERFSEVMWVLQQVLFMSFDRRLAVFLLDEAANTGSDTIKMTHEQIARHMGSAREVVSRMLKYFVSEGYVSASRADGIRILDRESLRRLVS